MKYGTTFSCVDAKGRDIPLTFPKVQAFRYANGSDGWRLLADFRFRLNGYIYTLKKGFDSDFASIPRAAWTLVGHPAGTTKQIGALYHDMMYCTHLVPREVADRMLVEIFEACDETPAICAACYEAVRVGGAPVWPKTDAEVQHYFSLLHLKAA